MLEMEKSKKSPKSRSLSGSVEPEASMCTTSPGSRPKSPPATLACPRPDFNTRATNTPLRFGWAAGESPPETEVKLEFLDAKEKTSNGHKRKVRSSGSPKKCGRDSSLQRSSPCPVPRVLLVPSADLEQQVEGILDPPACSGRRKTRSLGRSGLHTAASRAKCRTSPGQGKSKRDSGPRGCKLVPGLESPLRPNKRRLSRQEVCGWREDGETVGKKGRAVPHGAPSVPALVQPVSQSVQETSPDRVELDQSGEDEETRQANILAVHLAKDARQLKKWKKKYLLPGGKEKSGPPPSPHEPSCLKKVGAAKVEIPRLDSASRSPGSLTGTVLTPVPDIGRCFTIDLKDTCRVFCTLCQPSVRQRKTQGWSRISGLVRHLASKHGLEWERQPATGSPGEGVEGTEQLQQKALPTSATFGGRSPFSHHVGTVPSGDGDLSRPGQSLLSSLLLAPSTAARDTQDGTCHLSQGRAQAWNQSITELLCSLAFPLSFLSSQPFRRFMARVDPCYQVPSPGFFSDSALPLLHEAVSELVLQEMQWAEGGRVHLAASATTQDSVTNYVCITAHWAWARPGSGPVAPGGLRRRAVLFVRGLPLERPEEAWQAELLEQISLWLGRGSLQAGFLVSGGCPSLQQLGKTKGYVHIPCFARCLDSLVDDFLCHHNSVQIILGTARAIFSHFQGCAEARRLLGQLQQQCGLPAQQSFEELSDHWVSAYRLMEWVVEQQQALQAYAEKQQPGKASTALSAMFWSLADSLVKLLQPFEMVSREASTAQASLSQVLPQLRYLHIFLEQVHKHFVEQSSGEADVALRLAEGLALQLSTSRQLNELFYREEFVLATLLDPRFKGKVEAILPVGADIDHWKQVLVYKVKEVMVAECPLPTLGNLKTPKGMRAGTTRSPGAKAKGPKEAPQAGEGGSFLLVQREKSLLEQLESVGLLASEKSGASLSTDNHLANVMVRKYLRENETIGAQEDPLLYWEKRRGAWPALALLATSYLSCPPTGAFAEGVFASLSSPTLTEANSPLKVEAVEHLLFLKTNLGSFPHYTPPPLVFSSEDEQTP